MNTTHHEGIDLGTPECDLEIVNAEILERVSLLQSRTREGCNRLRQMGEDFAAFKDEVCSEANDPLAFLDEPILVSQLKIFDAKQDDLFASGSLYSMIERRKLVKALVTFKKAMQD